MEPDTAARDHHGIEVLGYDDCQRLLGAQVVGRVAFVDAGTPVITPVNYTLDGASIVFRSAVGAKLDAAERGRAFAFEIDAHDPATRTGWSVLATGLVEEVDDPDEVARLDPDAYALGPGRPSRLLRLRPDTVTGRRIRQA